MITSQMFRVRVLDTVPQITVASVEVLLNGKWKQVPDMKGALYHTVCMNLLRHGARPVLNHKQENPYRHYRMKGGAK